jgi:hypothetical protein
MGDSLAHLCRRLKDLAELTSSLNELFARQSAEPLVWPETCNTRARQAVARQKDFHPSEVYMSGSKRSCLLVGALVASLLAASPAQASSILPGNSVSPVDFAGGCACSPLLADTGALPVPWFISPFLQGSYRAAVYDRDPGAGVALEFLYQVNVSNQIAFAEFDEEIAVPSIYRVTMSDFAGWATDVAYRDPGGSDPFVAPSSADRTAGPGSTVGFSFFNPTILGGVTSYVLSIQTNATTFGPGSLTIIGGAVDRVTVAAFQPTGTPPPPSVPEPASLLLLGTGVVAIRRRLARK